jgi:hypothetical protein
VPDASLFTAASKLVNYIVGVGGQNAVNTHKVATEEDCDAFFDAVASPWESLDHGEHPFVSRLASQLHVEDDREEFLAGIEIVLNGLIAPC